MRRWMKVVFCFLLESFLRTCSLWIRQSQMKALEKRNLSRIIRIDTEKTSSVRYGNNDIFVGIRGR